MKASILSIALVASCAWEPYPVPGPVAPAGIATKPDPAAAVVAQCDRLGFDHRGASHRLCVMRGIDRLAVVPQPPQAGYAPIPILPYAYPPLAPQGSTVIIK